MNLMKNILLSLILIAILLISVSSISAGDADNDGMNMNSTNFNDSSHLQNIGGLNHDDYYSSEDSYNSDNISANDYNYNSETHFDNNVSESHTTSGNDFNNVGKISVFGKDDLNNVVVMQNSNSENSMQGVENVTSLKDIIKSSEYVVNKTSENTYTLTLADNRTMEIGVLQVFDLDSFKKATKYISTNNASFDAVIIDFKDNLNINFNPWANDLIKLDSVKNVIIRGYGATIAVNNPDKSNEYHFLNVNSDATVSMSNITLIGFNTAIHNHGTCQLTNVTFKSNVIDYEVDKDYGGAIRNWGNLKCLECSFLKNSAKYGGAIYNDKGSQSTFIDCLFKDNHARSIEKSSLETHDGNNIHTSRGASCLIANHNDGVQVININTDEDYSNFSSSISSIGSVRFLILNFTSSRIYNINSGVISLPMVENIYIYGNGATINVNGKDSDENSFLKIIQGQFCSINNLTISGFNKAIINQGSLSITGTHFMSNKVDYVTKEDFGGAIYNDEGLITISGSTFEEGYAKYGSAIYNNKGIISCKNCNFISNKAYKNGGAIYNNIGLLYCDGCNFTYNSADSGGGAIFNHYGALVLHNNTFDTSVAEDGGAIYNDFGEIIIDNCTFKDSKAENGKEVFNYGEKAKYSITANSYVIEHNPDGIIYKTINVTSDAPSTALRWTARIVEILLCVGIFVGTTLSGMPAAAAGVVCFVGGGLFAAIEEAFEEIYLDHNFNIYNCIVISVIAGLLDGIAGGLASKVVQTFVKPGCKIVEKIGINTVSVLVDFAFDFTSEVITEVIPRFDFTNNQVPTTILDLSNPQIH